MRAYLMTTGIIFGVLSLWHLLELLSEWGSPIAAPWFTVGMGLIVVVSGALCFWAFRLWRSA